MAFHHESHVAQADAETLHVVGSLIVAVLFPVGVAITGRPGWEIALATALAVLVVLRHLPNLRRLAQGAELRTDGVAAPPVDPPESGVN